MRGICVSAHMCVVYVSINVKCVEAMCLYMSMCVCVCVCTWAKVYENMYLSRHMCVHPSMNSIYLFLVNTFF